MFKIEDAPTNRTSCTISKDKIVKGERRLTANLGTGNYPKQYNPRIFAETHPNTIVELYSHVPDEFKVTTPVESYVTMDEVRETLKYVLGRDPTDEEMKRFINYLTKDVSEWLNENARSFARDRIWPEPTPAETVVATEVE